MQGKQSEIKPRVNKARKLRFWSFLLLLIVSAIAIFLFYPRPQQVVKRESNYAIHRRQEFNQPEFYPVNTNENLKLYRPVGEWVGKLILPTKEQMQAKSDWSWLLVQHAPAQAQNLIGQVVRLEWKNKPELNSYVKTTTRNVRFTPGTIKSQNKGIVHPNRLDGRLGVGPLQSLAGAKPNDDMIVTLDSADVVAGSDGKPVLQIEQEPTQATGRFYALVKILKPEVASSTYPAPEFCPGKRPCPSEYFRVRHYNQASGDFDGPEGTVRIPQQILDSRAFFSSTPRQIEASPAGKEGWYIYGARDPKGMFVVQAVAPRSLFKIEPDRVLLGTSAGLKYIKVDNWRNTEQNKGKIETVLLDPTVAQPLIALSNWKAGDKAIVMHLFGGIGGKQGEISGVMRLANTVPGHFAFGVAEVIRDPFTQELRFDIKYHQVYAHSPDAMISGTHRWADYMGNLQWGWAATRPVSDVVVKFEPVTQDYDFDGIKLSPLQEFTRQLQIMMARYRVGDGTGSATVSPATSCVQDASQALYITLKVIEQRVTSNPAIQKWLKAHPNDAQTSRFEKLVSLGSSLERQLSPLGIVRADWESNASALSGIGNEEEPRLSQKRSIWAALTSWRTMLPRQAHDELASIFLSQNAKLWFLRSNQIGGWQQDIIPEEATAVLGRLKLPFTNVAPIPILLNRVLASFVIPNQRDWLIVAVALLIYSAIALPLGFLSGFLRFNFSPVNLPNQLFKGLRASIIPAFVEEFVFRVLMLPHPIELVNWVTWSLWAAFCLLLFVVYHPFNAKTFYKAGIPTFFQPVFLVLTALLGLVCAIAYALTGCLWTISCIHWVILLVWLLGFGGMQKLRSKHTHRA